MKNISSIGATLAIIGFGLLPAHAVEKEINNNTNVTDATEQIKQTTETQKCPWYIPPEIC